MVAISRVGGMINRVTSKLRRSITTVELRARLRRDPKFRPDPAGVDVLLNFPDGLTNLYQVRQWYGPLEQLARSHRVAILCYMPESAIQIAEETDLKVIVTPSFTNLSEVETEIRPKVIFYPNQNYANYRILGQTESEHVFISHGESDKIYMASNWVKVFNYFFIAGQASHDRLLKHVRNYDVDQRTKRIGRPQIDIPATAPIDKPADRITVLYAPTWEGGRSSMRYGSVASHGLAIVDSLLSDSRFQIIYRPHPRTGIHIADVERADLDIRERLAAANEYDPGAEHLVDSTPFGWQLDYADFMIADVSAVTYDWLTTAKPLLITRPVEPMTVIPESGYLTEAPLLEAGDAYRSSELVIEMLADPSISVEQEKWSDYYYGDRSPGASMTRFIEAVDSTISEIESFRGANRPLRSSDGSKKSFAEDNPIESPTRASALAGYLRTAGTLIAEQSGQRRAFSKAAKSLESASTRRRAPIVVTCMAHHRELDNLRTWLPALEEVNRQYPVAIITGSLRTFNRLRKLTGLRLLITQKADEAEQIVNALDPTLILHFEQSTLNLREATYRAAEHVYVGEAHTDQWINNRLRLFDSVLTADDEQKRLVESSLVGLPSTIEIHACSAEHRVSMLVSMATTSTETTPNSP